MNRTQPNTPRRHSGRSTSALRRAVPPRAAWTAVTLVAAAGLVWVGAASPAGAQERGRRSRDSSNGNAPAPAVPTASNGTASDTGNPGSPSRTLPPNYSVLTYRSVFTRDPGRREGPPPPTRSTLPSTGPTTSEAPKDAEHSPALTYLETILALKGIADVDGEYVAFIEDPSAGKTLVLKTGDPIARGRIKGLNLDALEYEHGKTDQLVEVGQNFQGKAVALTAAPSPGSPSGGAPAAGVAAPGAVGSTPAAPAAGGAEDETVRRMRERRAREGG